MPQVAGAATVESMKRSTKRVVIGLVIGLPVAFVGIVVLLFLSAMGTFNGWAHRAPSVHSSEVEKARHEAQRRLDTEAAELDSLVDGEPLASGSADGCRYGQHNWKIQDDWAMECSRAIDTVLPGGTVKSFETDAARLHEQLLTDGWTPTNLGIDDVLTGYWQGHGGTDFGRFGHPYAPGDLPTSTYSNSVGDVVSVQWLSLGSFTFTNDTALFSETVVDNQPVDVARIARATPPLEYKVRLTVTAQYWHE